eukprot:1855224-Prymnesium_polylepis.1
MMLEMHHEMHTPHTPRRIPHGSAPGARRLCPAPPSPRMMDHRRPGRHPQCDRECGPPLLFARPARVPCSRASSS